MTDKQEREAHELIGLIRAAVLHPGATKRARISKPLLASAGKVLRVVEGTTRNELEIARTNLREL